MASFSMVDPFPSSIELSPHSGRYDLIIQNQASTKGRGARTRYLALEAKGSLSLQPLENWASPRSRSERCVIAGGRRRHALQPQRKKFRRHLTFDLTDFPIPNEETHQVCIKIRQAAFIQAAPSKGNHPNTEIASCHASAHLKSFHQPTKSLRDQQEQLDPRKPRRGI